jgi:hypothetical protein
MGRCLSRFFPMICAAALLSGCAAVGQREYQPQPNPVPRDIRHYQLSIDPPIAADRVRIEVIYRDAGGACPVNQAGVQFTPKRQGQGLSFQVALDMFRNQDGCQWQPNQLRIALRAGGNYNTNFSVPLALGRQVRWCRLNPEHGACMARERDIRSYKIPGGVHRVVVMQGR